MGVVMPLFLDRLIMLCGAVGVACEMYQTIHGWDHDDYMQRYIDDPSGRKAASDFGFPGSIMGYFLLVAAGVPLLITLNIWARKLCQFEMHVETFNASTALCRDEADR